MVKLRDDPRTVRFWVGRRLAEYGVPASMVRLDVLSDKYAARIHILDGILDRKTLSGVVGRFSFIDYLIYTENNELILEIIIDREKLRSYINQRTIKEEVRSG